MHNDEVGWKYRNSNGACIGCFTRDRICVHVEIASGVEQWTTQRRWTPNYTAIRVRILNLIVLLFYTLAALPPFCRNFDWVIHAYSKPKMVFHSICTIAENGWRWRLAVIKIKKNEHSGAFALRIEFEGHWTSVGGRGFCCGLLTVGSRFTKLNSMNIRQWKLKSSGPLNYLWVLW